MKKENKKLLLGIIIGILLASTTVYATTILNANEVSFNNTSSKLTSTNVQDALDELNTRFIQGERIIYRVSNSSWTLNQNISSLQAGTDFVTTKEAAQSMNNNASEFYLKYSVVNNTVQDRFVELKVTDSMANNNSGMNAGIYTLKGIDNDSTYEINKTILEEAFSNTYCIESGNEFTCNANGNIFAKINKNGTTIVGKNNYQCITSGKSGGTSYCEAIS